MSTRSRDKEVASTQDAFVRYMYKPENGDKSHGSSGIHYIDGFYGSRGLKQDIASEVKLLHLAPLRNMKHNW